MNDTDLNDNWLNVYRLAYDMFGPKPTPEQIAKAKEAYLSGKRPRKG